MYSIISALNGVYPESRGISAKSPSPMSARNPATAERRLNATMAAISRLANRKLTHVTTTPEYLAHILVPSTAYRANTAVDSRVNVMPAVLMDVFRGLIRIRMPRHSSTSAMTCWRRICVRKMSPAKTSTNTGLQLNRTATTEAFVFSTAS